MNIIILSYMYPRKNHPYFGIFIDEQVQALKHIIEGNITVISPIPWLPRLLWFRKKWRENGKTENKKVKEGIRVYYPRYFTFPIVFFLPLKGFVMYLSVRTLIKTLLKESKSRTILHTHTIILTGLAGVFLKKEFKIPHI